MSENNKKRYRKTFGKSSKSTGKELYWQEKAEQLQRKVNELEKEVTLLRKGLSKSKKAASKMDVEEYDPSWTWMKKIKYVLKQENRPMQQRELLVRLQQFDEYIKDLVGAGKILTVHISTGIKDGALGRYKIKGDGHFCYGLPEWYRNAEDGFVF